MAKYVKVGGTWKQVSPDVDSNIYANIKVGGSWKDITAAYIKVNGTWRQYWNYSAYIVPNVVGQNYLTAQTAITGSGNTVGTTTSTSSGATSSNNLQVSAQSVATGTYSSPQTIQVGGLDIMMVPWICSENYDETLNQISKSKAKVAMGHLELQGFRVNRSLVMEHGLEADIFKNFKKVFSGHYHTRSNNGTVFYTGNPYEIYWTDVGDTRGFTIFDTETLEHEPINNPYRMFHNIYYEDTNYQTFDTREYENKIVKVVVRKKTDTKKFEKFIDKLYSSNIAELKIVENFEVQESAEFEAFESEDTLSILNRYIEEAEVNLDKSIVQKLLQEVYQEACEIV